MSEVCEQYGIAPTQFYQWQELFFENGAAAFEPKKVGWEYELENKVKQLDKKLIKKDEVIAELVEHNIELKKTWRGLRDGWAEPDVRDEVIDYVR